MSDEIAVVQTTAIASVLLPSYPTLYGGAGQGGEGDGETSSPKPPKTSPSLLKISVILTATHESPTDGDIVPRAHLIPEYHLFSNIYSPTFTIPALRNALTIKIA